MPRTKVETNGTVQHQGENTMTSDLVPLQTQTAEGEVYESSLMASETSMETQQYHSFLQLAKQLPSMNPTFSISSKYFEFTQPGQSTRGIFLGITYIQCKDDRTGELKPLEAASWLDSEGTMFINAGATLVSAFRQFQPPKGCPVEISYEGKKDRTKLYEVRILVN